MEKVYQVGVHLPLRPSLTSRVCSFTQHLIIVAQTVSNLRLKQDNSRVVTRPAGRRTAISKADGSSGGSLRVNDPEVSGLVVPGR